MATSEIYNLAAWAVVAIYMATILFFVIRGGRQTKSMADYALGSIAFSPWAVGLSLAASMTSAATFIINPGFIAYYGVSGVLSMAIMLPLGALLSLVVFTKGFRKIGTSIKAQTIAQWVGSRYNSSSYKLFFAFVSLLLITFIVLICVGLTKLLATVLGIGELTVLVGIVVFVFGYMMYGGANSMVYTNMVQALLMIVVAVILLGSGLEHFEQGISGFFAKLTAIDPALTSAMNPSSYLFRDFFEVVVCQFVVGIAIVCQPHIITKSLLLKDESHVNTYLWVAVIVEALFFFVVFAGLYARIEFPDLTYQGNPLAVDSVLSTYVVSKFGVFVGLLVVIGLISAGLSTLEGLIQSLSTTITQDIIMAMKPSFTQEQLFKVNKVVIVFIAIAALYFSYGQLVTPDLSVGIFAQNGVYAYFSAAFVAVLFGTFLKNVPYWVPLSSSVASIAIHFTVYYGRLGWYMEPAVRNPAIAAFFAIVGSLGVGILLLIIANTTTSKLPQKSASIPSS